MKVKITKISSELGRARGRGRAGTTFLIGDSVLAYIKTDLSINRYMTMLNLNVAETLLRCRRSNKGAKTKGWCSV